MGRPRRLRNHSRHVVERGCREDESGILKNYLAVFFRGSFIANRVKRLTLIASQLSQLPCTLNGKWLESRARWEGRISCREQFVIMLMAQRENELLWAKSLPSKNNNLEIKFEVYPISKTEPCFQLFFSSGTGAFIQGLTTTLPSRKYLPPIQAPEAFVTGFVLPFTVAGTSSKTMLSLCCLAKSDILVRRGYVWGLKPRFLVDLKSPWDAILTRGRNGIARLPAEYDT